MQDAETSYNDVRSSLLASSKRPIKQLHCILREIYSICVGDDFVQVRFLGFACVHSLFFTINHLLVFTRICTSWFKVIA